MLNLVKINDVSSAEHTLSNLFKKYFSEEKLQKNIRYIGYDFLAVYNQSSDFLLHETKNMGNQMLKELGIFFYESYIPAFFKQNPEVSHTKSTQKGIVRLEKVLIFINSHFPE